MFTRPRITYLLVFCCVVWLGRRSAMLVCVGGEQRPRDLVLVNAIANKSQDDPRFALPVRQVGFCNDDRLVACSSRREEGSVTLWDIKTGRPVPIAESPDVSVKPSPGCCFATVPYPRLCFWTCSGLKVQDDLTRPHLRPIRLKHLLPGIDVGGRIAYPIEYEAGGAKRMGRVFFSGSDDYVAVLRHEKDDWLGSMQHDNSVHVWNARTGQHMLRFALPADMAGLANVRSMAFDPTDRFLAAGVDGPNTVIVWDLKTGREVLHSNEEMRVFEVAFSSSGDLICGEGGNASLDIGRIVIRRAGQFDHARSFNTPCGVTCLAVVQAGGIVTGDFHGQVILWHYDPEPQMGYCGRLLVGAAAKENCGFIQSVALGQKGALVAAGDEDVAQQGVARVWQVVSSQPAAK